METASAHLPDCLRFFLLSYLEECTREGVAAHPGVTRAVLAFFKEAEERCIPDVEDFMFKHGVPLDLANAALGLSDLVALTAALPRLPVCHLSLLNCYVGDVGLRGLCRSILESVPSSITGTSMAGGCGGARTLGYSALLRRLCFAGCAINDAASLAAVLHAAPQLQELDLSQNRLGVCPRGLDALCGAAQCHRALSRLDLSCNLLSGSRAESTLSSLSEMLVASARGGAGTLRFVDLSENQLGTFFALPDVGHSSNTSQVCGTVSQTITARSVILTPHTFPLLDALFVNNVVESLLVRQNGLPDSVVDWIEAKTSVNRRTRLATLQRGFDVARTIETIKLEFLGQLEGCAHPPSSTSSAAVVVGEPSIDLSAARRVILSALDAVERRLDLDDVRL